MSLYRWLKSSPLISAIVFFCLAQVSLAQDSSNPSWSATSQQSDPDGRVNPTRTTETHSEANGRVVDKTSIQTLGPDGRYVPYSETEKESVRVNDTTVRNIERTFAPGPNGERTLIQEKQEESRSLPGGEQKIVRTTSSPDANGALQVMRRELEDTKQPSPGVRESHTTVLTPDVNGGLTPAVQIDQRETKTSDGTIETRKSTMLSDGSGRWQLSEVRESTSKQENGQLRNKDERVLRPNANGTLAVVERTVTRQTDAGSGETHNTSETYSTNVPGQAGDDNLQLVQRESTVRRTTATGAQSTSRQVQQTNPGNSSDSLHVTTETIDIVRPGSSGNADQTRTILAPDSDGQLHEVWVDTGKIGNPAAIQVDTRTAAKPK
ncbi:MAG: hypothetical protein WA741_03180 [Candidatus Sulfotelmatobacter sp.]